MRWYAYDAVSGVWLHRDVPLSDVTETYTLSGPCAISGTVSPDFASLKKDDGTPLLSAWSTILVGEESDEVRILGIVTSTTATGSELQVEATGFSGYAQGYPLEQSITLSQTGSDARGWDPLDIVRLMWDRIQATPDSNLGVVVDPTTTNYRVGTLAYKTTTTTTKTVKKTKTGSASKVTTTKATEDGTSEIAGNDPLQVATPPPTHTVSGDGLTITDVTSTISITGATLGLNWYDNIDIGGKIDEYAKQTPFDYKETVAWANDSKQAVSLRLEIGYPRLGTKRSDLRFAEGENVTTALAVARSGDDFANAVTYLGAGEGSAQVRGTAAKRDGRLRRVKVETNQSLASQAACETQAAGELNAVSQLQNITQIVCVDHPNARFGDFGVGDDIFVRVYVGWELVGLWVRITAISRDDAGTMTLTTTRSDSFRYVSVTE